MFPIEVFAGPVHIRGVPDRGPGKWNYVLKGRIYVNNLSYNKRVGFHIDSGSGWIDLLATYVDYVPISGGGQLEIWEYDSPTLFAQSDLLQPLRTFRFAVFYDNLDWGTSYWDNNWGGDYFVPATP